MAYVENINDWRTPLYKYLAMGELLIDIVVARKMKIKGARFTMIDGILYKRAFTMPLLKCQEAKHDLAEVHSRVCGEQLGGSALTTKILRVGFLWPML